MPHRDPFLMRQIVPRPESMQEVTVSNDGKSTINTKSNFGAGLSKDGSS